ncbi:U3 small nucleolar RNA-interacting protein 2 [Tribolium castaneum]|uniref:U3 small nucleolar RNA-interacting protein 2-like Protein n=1 Tax=Tribolium castaneum TaxID=7070 RepID=D6W6V3_TRICA|nr:PREDICTED: U3 small nucleolar RNA-interacting protein 2 [Tribolium castaneum]EFA11465.1 U3 small nucleolar RNA-interacting protein 2-like Protein [Tribolium castaneum]|eukprot:XP_966896.1 PREDICTED: U3 small nucleolar RNA-interacting protein 2 [Tribolium castaneum]
MSFFIKSKSINGTAKFSADKRRKRRAEPASSKNEEVTSSEDEDSDHNLAEESEDEHETAQEKKLRLAKVYLEEIEREEQRRLQDKEVSKEVISERLKTDHLKQIGKYRITIADKYQGVDQSNYKVLKCREQQNTITCLCLSSDDNWVFSGSKDGIVVKWSLKENKKFGIIPFVKVNVEQVKGHTGCIYSIAISTDSKFLVVGDSSNLIQVWDPQTLQHVSTLKGHKKPVTALCLKHNSHTLYSASSDRSVRVWTLDEMAFVETLFGHQDGITSIDVLNSDKPLSSGGRDGTVRLWKVSEESQLIFNAHPGNIDCVKWISDQYFVSGGDDGQVSVWSCLKKKPISCVKAAHGVDSSNNQPFWISAVGSHVHSDVIASGSQDGFLRLWKLENKFLQITKLFEIPVPGFINALAFTSDGRKLVVGVGRDHRLGRWNTVKSAVNSIHVIPLQIND